MKYFIFFILILHGLVHLLGFVKGFQLMPVANLQLNIAKTTAVFWLLSVLLFFASAVLQFSGKTFWPVFTLFAVALSSMLILLAWQDAKWGMLPNILLFLAATTTLSVNSMQRKFDLETREILAKNTHKPQQTVTENDLKDVPVVVRKWLRNSGIVGKPVIHSGRIRQKALMKMKPDQKNWKKAEALQYTTIDTPAFIWTVDMKMFPMVNLKGRDKFADGKGEMRINLFGMMDVVNEHGPRIDEGSLQRYLGEMVWFPSLALNPLIRWESADEFSATATMHDKGTSGSGTFYFDENGDFVKFTALRFKGNKEEARRHLWILTVSEYAIFEGIKVPSRMQASWQMDHETWTWLKLEICDIKYNISSFIH